MEEDGEDSPSAPSQELPMTVREGLMLEIPPSVPSLEKEFTQVPCWQVHRRTCVDWPSSGIPGYREAGPCLSLSFQGLRKPLLHPCPQGLVKVPVPGQMAACDKPCSPAAPHIPAPIFTRVTL